MSNDSQEIYHSLWISEVFHDFPHLDFHFNNVNNSFNPALSSYKQALVFWGLSPVVLCILLWLVFLVYFIFTWCCPENDNKVKISSCPKICTFVLVILGVGLIGFGLYENENGHRAIDTAKLAATDGSNSIKTASLRIKTLDGIAIDVSQRIVSELRLAVSNITNETVRASANESIANINAEATNAHILIESIDIKDESKEMDKAINIANDVEYYRWVITIILYGIVVLLFVITVVGILLRSTCTLKLLAGFFFICSFLIWITTGAYLGASVALGDLCMDPDSYFISLVKNAKAKETTTAYIKCNDTSKPYLEPILSAQSSITKVGLEMDKLVSTIKPYNIPNLNKYVAELKDDLEFASGNLSTLLTNVGICTNLHHIYIKGINSVCIDGMTTSSIFVLISLALALICTFVILSLSCTWKELRKRKRRTNYVPVDDSDPFLPRPPAYDIDYGTMGRSTPRPWSERGSLQQASSNQEENFLPLDDSPPPAYHPGKYIRRPQDPSSASH